MGKLPSYEDLQKKIVCLENELAKLKSEKSKIPFDVNQSLFFDICEYSKNAIVLFETFDNGISFIIKYLNKRAEEIENLDRSKIIGEKLSDCIPTAISSGFIDSLKAVYASENPMEFPDIMIDESNKIIEWKHNYIYKLSKNEIVSIYLDERNKKTKEIELFENQEKLRLAMESANYFSFEINPKTYKITTQKEVYTALGYDTSEIINLIKTSGSLVHPEDYKKVKKQILKNLKNKVFVFNSEFRIKSKSDKWVWFSASGRNIEWDKNGNPSRIVGLLKDVQEEKEMQLRLEEGEEKYKSLVNLLPEPIFESDINGNLRFANLKAFQTFEYTLEDFNKGINIIQVIAPEDIERAKTNFIKILKAEKIADEEYTSITKTGKRLPVLIYSNVIIENNKIKGLRGIVVDITERKKTQQKLRDSEENFRQLSENINDGFWLRTLKDKIIYANPACYNIVGSNFKYIFENTDAYKNWTHPDDRKKMIGLKEQISKNPEKEYSYEHRIICPNGRTKWVWIRTFPVYNENGKLYRCAGIISDITEQKKLLSDLIIAKEKAEESDKLKSAFLANMSHEIRTPMNGILGFAELLNDKDITEEEKEKYLRIININGKQLLNLINDIIDVAKIEAGQLSIDKTVAEINPFLKEIYLFFKKEQKRLKKGHINFSLEIPVDKNNIIFTDIIRLQQIIYNLINNAFKFTNSGSLKFGYEIINENSKDYYLFFVKDTGIGIPDDKKDFIFERFGQIKSKIVLNQKGTGLGLAISKGLVELLGGKIWVESIPENLTENKKGQSTFYFTIPIIDQVNKSKNTNHKKKKNMKRLKNINILVVEDDEHNLEFIKKLLLKFGANVVVATTGKDAIEIIKTDKSINMVLMDIRLPDIDGFETTQKIKSLRPDMPVIAQTAYAMYNDRKICLENGCDDYISKPLNKDILYKKINDYIYN